MEEIFSEYIGVIAFLLFLVFPRLFRMLTTRGGRTPTKVEQTLEDLLQGEVNLPKVESEAELTARWQELAKLHKRLERLKAKVAELHDLCRKRGGTAAKLLPVIEAALESPIAALFRELGRLQSKEAPPGERELNAKRGRIRTLNRVADVLSQMADQRLRPANTDLLEALDAVAKAGLMPYRAHAQRSGAALSTRFALAVQSDAADNAARLLAGSPVAAVTASPRISDLPRGWVQPVSDIGADVFHSTPGLDRALYQSAGATPLAVSSIGQVARNPRVLLPGLVGSWLPRIFGDAAAALYLGPGAASGLAATIGKGEDEDRAVTAYLATGKGTVPAHIRMFVICRALTYGEFSEESAVLWEEWQSRLRSPENILVADDSGRAIAVPVAAVLQAVLQATDAAIAAPMRPLGSALINISGLLCTRAEYARMSATAESLLEGTPVNAPPRILVGGALLAAKRKPTLERRIGSAALKSLRGGAKTVGPNLQDTAPHVTSVVGAAASLPAVRRAVVLGALIAPRRRAI